MLSSLSLVYGQRFKLDWTPGARESRVAWPFLSWPRTTEIRVRCLQLTIRSPGSRWKLQSDTIPRRDFDLRNKRDSPSFDVDRLNAPRYFALISNYSRIQRSHSLREIRIGVENNEMTKRHTYNCQKSVAVYGEGSAVCRCISVRYLWSFVVQKNWTSQMLVEKHIFFK